MTQLTSAAFKTSTASLYPDNSSGQISAADIRAQMDNIADSAVFKFTDKTTDPGLNDDIANSDGAGAVDIGAVWINTTNLTLWMCVDNTENNAIWHRLDFIVNSNHLLFGTRTEAINSPLLVTADIIQTGGFITAGDLGAGIYKRVASEPTHAGKFQAAIDGSWWQIASIISVPQHFAVTGDGVTDDSAGINAWADYLRVSKAQGKWPGGTYFCGTTTIHLGLCSIRGAGAPGNNRWSGSLTNVISNANPIFTNTDGGAQAVFGRLDIENIIFAGAGGTVATIDIWDIEDYSGQLGGRLGYATMVADAGVPEDLGDDFAQGFGTNRIVNCGFQDISGWGLYLYKSWGDSIIEDNNFRCCGGKAAYDYGISLSDVGKGDRSGGAICVAANTVDTEFNRNHGFGSGYHDGTLTDENYTNGEGNLDSLYNNRGTFIKLGAEKTDTDALFRDYYTCNKINFTACHNEGYEYAFAVFGTKWTAIHAHNSNGGAPMIDGVAIRVGKFMLGWASNPTYDTRLQFTSTRVGSAKEVTIAQGTQVSLGEWINATPGDYTPIKYWVPCTGEFNGAGPDQPTLLARGFTLEPQLDPTTAPGGSGITDNTTWFPQLITKALSTSLTSNLLPDFNGGLGTTLAGWTEDSNGTQSGGPETYIPGTLIVDPSGASASIMGEKTITHETTGLVAGTLMTLQFWVDWSGALGLGNLVFHVKDGSDVVVFTRYFGSGSVTDGKYYKYIQFLVPADGTIRVSIRNGEVATAANIYTPILNVGAAERIGTLKPSMWIASNGFVNSAATSRASLMIVADEKANTTAGGTFTAGAWETRELNTVRYNNITGASLATNQITLPIGTFRVSATAPALKVNQHLVKLYNITDSSDDIIGAMASSDAGDNTQNNSSLSGIITLATPTVFELQHRGTATFATEGFGRAASFGVDEVYSVITIEQIV